MKHNVVTLAAAIMVAGGVASAFAVMLSRRRHSRISPAMPDGAEGNGTFVEIWMVKFV